MGTSNGQMMRRSHSMDPVSSHLCGSALVVPDGGPTPREGALAFSWHRVRLFRSGATGLMGARLRGAVSVGVLVAASPLAGERRASNSLNPIPSCLGTDRVAAERSQSFPPTRYTASHFLLPAGSFSRRSQLSNLPKCGVHLALNHSGRCGPGKSRCGSGRVLR